MSRLVVVDASVTRAAGETEHPVSSACRSSLEAIRAICHRVALTAPIKEEWRRHTSRFSRKWRRAMAARRKLPTNIITSDVSLRWDLYSDAARTAIEKDMALIEAALAADKVIVTLDDSLRQALGERPDGLALLRAIRWIHPVTDGIAAIRAL